MSAWSACFGLADGVPVGVEGVGVGVLVLVGVGLGVAVLVCVGCGTGVMVLVAPGLGLALLLGDADAEGEGPTEYLLTHLPNVHGNVLKPGCDAPLNAAAKYFAYIGAG